MKSMIVIALALTSVASFSATTKTCANLKGAELAACEAKSKAPVAAPAAKEVKAATVETKEVKKDAPVVTAKNTKTTTATTAPVAAPAKK